MRNQNKTTFVFEIGRFLQKKKALIFFSKVSKTNGHYLIKEHFSLNFIINYERIILTTIIFLLTYNNGSLYFIFKIFLLSQWYLYTVF